MIHDSRRAPRRHVTEVVPVIDTMTDEVVGQLGNLSESGMLLIASAPLLEDALYQLRFHLPGPHQFLAPFQKSSLVYEVAGIMNVGGCEVRLPKAMVYRDSF